VPLINKKQIDNKDSSGFICRRCATLEELKNAPPFTRIKLGSKSDVKNNKHIKKTSSILKIIAIGIIVLLVLGFLIDLFSGFYILRHSKSVYAGLVGLLIVAIFSLIGEAGSEWISRKDDVAHPLYKRAFHLFILLLFAALVLTIVWFALNYLGLLRI
jgi:hypothetical protein